MRIEELLDVHLLDDHIEKGNIEVRRHPTLPLNILCYTRQVKYGVIWDDVTLKCRGLIVDDDGVVVSRPYEKSFNLGTEYRPETMPLNLPEDAPMTVLDKLDGSFGVFYEYESFGTSDPVGATIRGVATKGSFTSEQAKFATAWYHEKTRIGWPKGYTPCFEIVCQHIQSHPVRYSPEDDNQLYLLGLVNKETGEEFPYEGVKFYGRLNGIRVVEEYKDLSLHDAFVVERDNKEGYVVSFDFRGKPPLKLKVKHDAFLKLQAVFHEAKPKKILEALTNRDYETLDKWENSLDPDKAQFIRDWRAEFGGAYLEHLAIARNLAIKAMSGEATTRKEVAEFLLKPENKKHSSLAFAIIDGQDDSEGNLHNVQRAGWKLVAEQYAGKLAQRDYDESN